jgi:Tol biopolymer transport system component
MSLVRASAVTCLIVAAVLGCSDPTASTSAYRIVATGYVERGNTLTLTLLDGASSMPASNITWSATPKTAVTVLPGGVAKLTDTGRATIYALAGGRVAVLPLHIAVPPTIVFDLQDDGGLGNRDVYRMTLDGQGLTRLTSGVSDNEQPTASATQVVFTSYRTGRAGLYAVSPGGGTETALSAAPMPASQAAFSPDGTELAFISPSAGLDHLWTSRADGSGAAVLSGSADYENALQGSPTWSPTNSTIAVMSTEFGNPALVRLTLGADSEIALTRDASTDLSPAWSPDGRTIAFASTRDGGLGIFLLPVSGGGITPLAGPSGANGEPAWLADGRIIYTSNLTGSTQLRWVDPAHPDSGQVIPTPVGGNPHNPKPLPMAP